MAFPELLSLYSPGEYNQGSGRCFAAIDVPIFKSKFSIVFSEAHSDFGGTLFRRNVGRLSTNIRIPLNDISEIECLRTYYSITCLCEMY